jgi:hypothetical protein
MVIEASGNIVEWNLIRKDHTTFFRIFRKIRSVFICNFSSSNWEKNTKMIGPIRQTVRTQHSEKNIH